MVKKHMVLYFSEFAHGLSYQAKRTFDLEKIFV